MPLSELSSWSAPPKMYEPMRQLLNFRHIEKINYLVFNYRELSRHVTSQIGWVPVPIVAALRRLNDRIQESIDALEQDMARNERAPFEAKLNFYTQEYDELSVTFQQLIEVLSHHPLPLNHS
uniref:Uncharacterized protein n=1 Tax=Caenorhabditis japonica TaxID=281687 RepID=A0A8R1HR94_CAEJA